MRQRTKGLSALMQDIAHTRADTAFLAAGGVEVWRARILPGGEWVGMAEAVLSPAEWQRAARFRVQPAREQFLLGRWVARSLLGACLGTEPAAVQIIEDARGKPELAASHRSPLRFNIAHSGEMVLVALCMRLPVGVDVEMSRPLSDRDALARRFFAPTEWSAIAKLPEPERTDAFFRCWTRKEALLKAWGTGFSLPLDAFEVPLNWPLHGRRVECPRVADGEWVLWDLDVPPGYTAALAVRCDGGERPVTVRDWPV